MNVSLTRITSTAGAGVVAAIAAWSSWSHQVHVATMVGESERVALVLPLSVDGLLVVASAAMVDDKRSGRTPRWSARLAFAVGVLATVGANIASAEPTTGARLVASWPAVALLLVVELLSRRGRQVAPTEQEIDEEEIREKAFIDGYTQAVKSRIDGEDTSFLTNGERTPDRALHSVPTSPAVPRLRRTATSPLTGRPLGGPR